MNEELLHNIRNAYWVCKECGEEYGAEPLVDQSTWHDDTCEICEEDHEVTLFRNYGYEHPDFKEYEN